MERSSSPSKVLLVFLLQFLLLSEPQEARILGDAYDYKNLLASGVDGDAAALPASHLNLADVAGNRRPFAPPAPKVPPPPHHLHGDGAHEQHRSPPASTSTEPAPPRDYSRQQAEAAGHQPMMDVSRAFLQAIMGYVTKM
ncbi:hypothetical protein CFC21_003765 [Triticum aestivum]|uniref:Uncharacterized protein n=3 Tax=Triticum TaxID=4564 RepID=A0A9R0V0U3_TRITD|nr:uncharacterized protein LOC123180380 [Triticum aestivum]EMS53675.1 hypothetical protein TRIUR3_07666 [Triticum urartu]KAF6985964.1 hypothetical protein CFC21_003765 [Triticum aestivum]VAH10105.1 unnamed protein product [Triticum turgidum subsp. durum]